MTAHLPQLSPKRLVHMVASLAPEAGGTTEGIRRLVGSSLDEVVCLDDPAVSFLREQSLPVHALGPVKSHYGFTPRLAHWLQLNVARFDGLVIHGLWQFHSYGAYRIVRTRKPYVVFPHGMLDPYFKRAFPWKHLKKQAYWLAREYRVLRDARAVCFTTPIERDTSTDTFWPRRWNSVVVSFGTAAPAGDPAKQRECFLEKYPALRRRRFFLFLSRIHSKKGCDLLLDAMGRLAPVYPDVDLVLAGPDEGGLRRELDAQAKRLGIGDRIHWTGMLEGDLKWGALHSAFGFVLPSHQENFGVAVVEALACATPVLISDKVNIWPDIAADGAGLVHPDTVDGTFHGMTALLDMPQQERERMIANGLACFEARYEMKRTAEALHRLF